MKKAIQTVKNPLRRRILREFTGDWKKYLVIGLFLILMIGFISGVYVANGSMLTAFDESPAKFRTEDGHFVLSDEADRELLDRLEDDENITIYQNYYREEKESWSGELKGREKLSKKQKNDVRIRIYTLREDVDLPCIMSGRLPEKEDEIAIDRMHAENVGLKVGGKLKAGDRNLTITGFVSNADYTTLFENSRDMMFDALTFDVGLMTQEGVDTLSAPVRYNYSYLFTTEGGNGQIERAADDIKEKEKNDDLMENLYQKVILTGNQVDDFVPAYANQAIQFAPEDFSSDEAMAGIILYVLIAVLAFVFAITISNTITRESTVIGTLRASGFSRGELIRHYMAAPLIVTLISALIGNLLGYTYFKNVVVAMYYNSYGLPTYETVMSSEALIKTTIIPIVIMFVINLIVIAHKMRYTPLQFLRRDLKKHKRSKAMRLPSFNFLSRFRLRVLIQNISGYFILFVGICFVMIMLAMAVGMPDSLGYYQKKAPEMVIAPYETLVKTDHDIYGEVIKTKEKSAEQFSASSLVYTTGGRDENLEVYGIIKDSEYLDSEKLNDLDKDEIIVSKAMAGKFKLKTGDTIRLSAKYEDKKYTFKIAGINSYEAGSAVFMPVDRFRDTFDTEDDSFSGWFSREKISDVDEKYIFNEITAKDITKMVDQLDHSMGDYMHYFQYLCIGLSAILMFLLSKLIIERNENPISMTKILGYTNREISSIYVTATTIAVIISEFIAAWIGYEVMIQLWKKIMSRMNGWFDFYLSRQGVIKMLLFVFIGYLIVMLLDFRRIKKIPMDQALKVVD